MFRKLHAHEIEMRALQVKNTGSQWLLYKDARCDMHILDETVGPGNWQRDHKELKGVIYCGVAINANYKDSSLPKEWVWKWDAGAESNEDKQKGEASDSFKRSCTNHGIGRELYTPLFIWIQPDMIPVKDTGMKNSKGKPIYKVDSFENPVVTFVEYNDQGLIKHLIVEHDGKEVFRFPRKFSGGKPSEAERNEIAQSDVNLDPDPPKKAAPKPADKPKPNTTSISSDNAGIQKLLNVTATDKYDPEDWKTTRWMFKPEFNWLIMHDNADDIKKVMDHFESAEGIGIGRANKEKLNERIAELSGISTEKVDIPDSPYANEQEMEDELDDLPF